MSDIERAKNTLPIGIESTANTSGELTGIPEFHRETFLERQAVIDGIMDRNYETEEDRVADLNSHIAGWDDERGISYTYIAGRALPGLEIHVPATAIAFAANYAPEANFEGANLDYAVFSASVMPDIRLKRASLDHAVMPMAQISGSMVGVSAVKSVMNLADVSGLDMKGVDLGVAYLIGARGISEEKLLQLADSQEVVSELASAVDDSEILTLLGDGLSRFSGGDAVKDIIRRLRRPQAFSDVNAAGTILRKQPRDRRQGMALYGVNMNSSEISKYDFEGNVWYEVMADRAQAISTRLAGAILLYSSLDNVDSRGSYAPGMIAMNSSFRGTPLPKNSAGSVYYNCDLTGASVHEVEEGGTVIIGDKAPVVEEDMLHIRVLSHDQVPEPVLSNLERHANLRFEPRNIESPARELEA